MKRLDARPGMTGPGVSGSLGLGMLACLQTAENRWSLPGCCCTIANSTTLSLLRCGRVLWCRLSASSGGDDAGVRVWMVLVLVLRLLLTTFTLHLLLDERSRSRCASFGRLEDMAEDAERIIFTGDGICYLLDPPRSPFRPPLDEA